MPFVDSDVFIALLKSDDPYESSARKLITLPHLYTSSLVLVELSLVLRREVSEILSLQLPKVLGFNGKIIDFTSDYFELSTKLRQKHNLGIFDAAHAAVALKSDGIIISSDKAFDHFELKRIPLER